MGGPNNHSRRFECPLTFFLFEKDLSFRACNLLVLLLWTILKKERKRFFFPQNDKETSFYFHTKK